MLRFILCLLWAAVAPALHAQLFPGLTLPPSGGNQKASVTQYIGPVAISISYSSPKVHGPDGNDRHGQIWGKLVPYGLTDLGFGNGKPGPWRAGANENTVFAVSNDVTIGGKTLPAGRYGLHMIAGPDEWTVVFSKDSGQWGSFFYEEKNDALRVKATPHKNAYREWLSYEFTERKPAEATVELQWEDLAVPWTIQIPNINDVYVSKLSEELTTVPGFHWRGYISAAQFCLNNNTHLEQGLDWADKAITIPGIGQANFETLRTKSQLLAKLGKNDESRQLMDTALKLPGTSPLEIHQYGRQLITAKKNLEALEIFKLNAQRNGDAWPVHVGLARGYAAVGDIPQALEHAKKALEQAPDPLNKQSLETMVKTFSAGQNISQ
jgi:hypothetical protein